MIVHPAVRWSLPGTPVQPHGAPAEPHRPFPPEVLALPVLIIEDEAMIGWLLESLLEDFGFASIRIAASAAQAIALAGELAPGLVVSDINLGPYSENGIEAVARIAALAPVAVLFVTAHTGPETREQIDRLGLQSPVLRKPVSADGLRAAIAEVCAAPRRH